MKLDVYQRVDGKWAWRLVVNGNIVAIDANQGYENKRDAEEMALKVVSGQYRKAVTDYQTKRAG